MATSIHERLREQTRAEHSAAEASLEDGEVLRSLSGYGEFLRVQLALLESWELSGRHGLEEPFSSRWSRADGMALIRDDLRYLGLKASPRPPTQRWAGGASQSWGIAYVIEGSALGGRVLARRVADPLGLDTEGLSFLRSGGAPARWRAFLADLELAAREHPSEAIVEGAKEGFAFVLQHLGRVAEAHARG